MKRGHACGLVLSLVVVTMIGTQMPGGLRDRIERSLHAPIPLSSLAHFVLFISMSCLLAARPIAWAPRRIGACMLGLAVLTETLQIFAIDRHPRLLDIGIDMAGFAAGVALSVYLAKVHGRAGCPGEVRSQDARRG
jgi:VanZ family protein